MIIHREDSIKELAKKRKEVEILKQKAEELELALLEMTNIAAEQEQAILELSMLSAGGAE